MDATRLGHNRFASSRRLSALALAFVLALIAGPPSDANRGRDAYAVAQHAAAARVGLVAAYSFGEGRGKVVNDLSGNHNDGSLSHAAWSRAGKFGGAVSLTGGSSRVVVRNSASLGLTNAMTVEAWVKPAARARSRQPVIAKQGGAGLAYALYAGTMGRKPSGYVALGRGVNAPASRSLQVGRWTFLSSTFDGSTLRLYVNGRLVKSSAARGGLAPSSGPLRLGGGASGPGFRGLMDEVRVYNRPLSAGDVRSDMATALPHAAAQSAPTEEPAPPPPPPPPPPPGGGGGGGGGSSDAQAPSAPANLAKTAVTATSVSLAWSESTDNVGVLGYELFANDVPAGLSSNGSYTVSGLACATSYDFSVDAYDAAGNRSGKASLTVVTSACPSGGPTPDTQAPSTPTGLAKSASTAASVTLAWNPSTDNVGVLGYEVFKGGVLSGTATGGSFTVAGLSCGASYSFSVDAFDAAGNRSAKASLTAAAGACPPPPPPAGGLVAAYGFDAGSGTNVADSSGNGNSGTAAATTWVPGKYGDALSFNGTNSWVSVADSASLDLTGAMTLEAWVNPSALGTARRMVLGKEGTGELVYGLYANTGQSTSAGGLDLGSGAEAVARGQLQLPLNSWTYLALTYDGATLTMYENGSSVGSFAVSRATLTSTGVLHIGGNAVSGQYFQGLIDEVRIYSKSLTQAQVMTDMNTSVTGAPVPAADTSAPSTPGALAASGATQTSVNVSWSAATDNVGVTGYGLYKNGAAAGTSSATSSTVSSLSCATSYSLAVDAFDAAGNRSAKATVTASTSACTQPPPPPPSGSGTVFLSASGSDSNACTQSAPCRGFDRAYHAAQAGQVVSVAAGSYGSQTVNSDGSKTSSSDVVFQPAGGTVSLGSLTVQGADHVTFKDLSMSSWDVQSGSADVTFQNIKAASFMIWGPNTDSINVLGGDYGFATAPNYSKIISASGPPTNVLLDGVTIHDVSSPDLTQFHAECLMLWAGDGITIRNSRFYHCAVFDVEFQVCCGSTTMQNVTLENNFFAPPTQGGYITVNFVSSRTTWRNFVFRNNSFDGPIITAQGSDSQSGGRAVGNLFRIAGNWECPASIATAYNVFASADGSSCPGSTNRTVSNPGWANPGAFDYHLTASSPALGAASPTDFPSTDIDGEARPAGGAPDAGADER